MVVTEHVRSSRPSTRRLVRIGALAGALAAVGTTVVAVIASVADISLEVDGEAIPIPAFAMWTVVATALGVVLAWLVRARRRFVGVAAALTGLSLVPAIVAPDDAATKGVLVVCHVLAALVIVPALGSQLERGT